MLSLDEVPAERTSRLGREGHVSHRIEQRPVRKFDTLTLLKWRRLRGFEGNVV